MESKPVSTKQKELLVTILIDNIPVCISTERYYQLIEWIDRYNSYQIGLEIYPPESNIHKQYAIKSKIALETLKKLKNELKKEINHIRNNIWKSLNMTKDQLNLLNIEDTITNLGRLLFILEQFKYLKDISK